MNWKSHGYLLLSRFFYGYSAGFATSMGVISSIDPTQFSLFNLGVFPCISGLMTVFPQLTKTFADASKMKI